MSFAPHIVFYLRFSKFWTKNNHALEINKIMVSGEPLNQLEAKFYEVNKKHN
jgi:hypothetical protein